MSTMQVLFVSLLIAVVAADGMQVSRRGFATWKALRALSRNSVRNAPPKCHKAIDLAIVMDRSLQTTGPSWNEVMQITRTLVSNFDISDDMTHVGAISYDQTAEVLLKFNDLFGHDNSLEGVKRHMDTWRPGTHAEKHKNTVIDHALQLALTNLFTDRDGARGYEEVLVLLTYGNQNSDAAAKIARRLELEANVIVLVVGIGEADPIELWKLAGAMTDPTKGDNVFYVPEPNMAKSVAEQVARAVCDLFKSVEI
ncbi:vitrin-like isoform X1 [Oculina patagonica]